MTAADDVILIGFAGLSATVVRTRLLGVVTADRLAHLHLLAVRDDRRRTGPGGRLVRAFDDLALRTGAVMQAVARPEDTAAVARHTALGAGVHLAQDRDAPGEHRLVLTRSRYG